MRKDFEMTQKDLEDIYEASRPVSYMVFGGMEPTSPQENANRVWQALGKKMGFKHMTVKPTGQGDRFFSAEIIEEPQIINHESDCSTNNEPVYPNKECDCKFKKFNELETLAKPLQDWMMKNFAMVCRIEITCENVTVLSPEMGSPLIAKGL